MILLLLIYISRLLIVTTSNNIISVLTKYIFILRISYLINPSHEFNIANDNSSTDRLMINIFVFIYFMLFINTILYKY